MTWRFKDIVVDAVRNVAGTPTRTVLLGVVSAGVVGALAFTELAFTQNLLDFRTQFEESGGYVVVATKATDGNVAITADKGLSAERCAALSDIHGITAAAAVQVGPLKGVNTAPGTLFRTGTLTADGLDLFTSGTPPTVANVADRWILGVAAADELGVRSGMWLVVGEDARQVGAVIDTDERYPQIARWIMTIAAPFGMADECWVEYDSGVTTGRTELVDTVLATTAGQLVARPLIRLDRFARNPVSELAVRPQAQAWFAAGLVLAAIAWLATWFRRAHIGLYRALGTTPSGLFTLGAVEYALPTVIGGAAGALWAIATWVARTGAVPSIDQILVVARTAASTLLFAVILAPILWPLAGRGSIAQQLKDR